MPTKRRRRARSSAIPSEIRSLLHMGCGLNHADQDWAREQWNKYGVQLTEQNERQGFGRPFAEVVFGPPQE